MITVAIISFLSGFSTLGIIIAALLIYAAWLIRCIMNAQEESYEMEETSGMEVDEHGNLIETKTAIFHH